jgi:hypothetical protein
MCKTRSFLFFIDKKFTIVFSRILNKLTPEKFDSLKDQLLNSGITTVDILQVLLILSRYFIGHCFCFVCSEL